MPLEIKKNHYPWNSVSFYKTFYKIFSCFYSDEEYVIHPSNKEKTMCVVDSGIAFNSPFPAVLRAERNVELILSFDFSQKDDGDDGLPFVVSGMLLRK